MRNLATLICVCVLAAPALSQSAGTWSVDTQRPDLDTALHYGVEPLDDGGVLTFVGEASSPTSP